MKWLLALVVVLAVVAGCGGGEEEETTFIDGGTDSGGGTDPGGSGASDSQCLYGAVSIGQQTETTRPSWGLSWDHPTRESAIHRSMAICRQAGIGPGARLPCSSIGTACDGGNCTAIAVSSHLDHFGRYRAGWASHGNRADAQRQALDTCRLTGVENCQIVVSHCMAPCDGACFTTPGVN